MPIVHFSPMIGAPTWMRYTYGGLIAAFGFVLLAGAVVQAVDWYRSYRDKRRLL